MRRLLLLAVITFAACAEKKAPAPAAAPAATSKATPTPRPTPVRPPAPRRDRPFADADRPSPRAWQELTLDR